MTISGSVLNLSAQPMGYSRAVGGGPDTVKPQPGRKEEEAGQGYPTRVPWRRDTVASMSSLHRPGYTPLTAAALGVITAPLGVEVVTAWAQKGETPWVEASKPPSSSVPVKV